MIVYLLPLTIFYTSWQNAQIHGLQDNDFSIHKHKDEWILIHKIVGIAVRNRSADDRVATGA